MSTINPSSVHWRKSTYSDQEGGNCVEVASWRTSSHSDSSGGNCVEVGGGVSVVAFRDSKDSGGPVLAFGRRPSESW
ncbi:DUF397 domain-containing protein [Actinomadura sp. 7K534]|uniref:DUF397 domain-containing protein n=1 Tax=Actinomadura sp. 7K534 TaxID=2530366 RepID=UPI0010454A8C|nr:DUF397 domain-containing protein [Actinomadura sp. 7K534]TDB97223.1 DUF397 domain-containing protein [Actinomadura sp. 7K534]